MSYSKSLIIFLFIICIVPKNVLGQNSDKEVKYANVDGKYITKKEFNKCLASGYISKTAEDDDNIVHYLSHNSFEGKLTETENKQIRLMIGKIVGKEIDSNRTIVIHLYNKNDKKLQHDINYNRYWNAVKRSRDKTIKIYDAFLIGNKNSGIYPNPKKHVYLDSYNFLNKTFFNNSDLDYNHIVIRPDGAYNIFLGFFDNLYVLDRA